MPFSALIAIGIVLFGLGAAIFMTRTTPLLMLVGVELMLNAANLNLVAFSRLDPLQASGQVFALFIMVVAVAETAVLLAILTCWARQHPQVATD